MTPNALEKVNPYKHLMGWKSLWSVAIGAASYTTSVASDSTSILAKTAEGLTTGLLIAEQMGTRNGKDQSKFINVVDSMPVFVMRAVATVAALEMLASNSGEFSNGELAFLGFAGLSVLKSVLGILVHKRQAKYAKSKIRGSAAQEVLEQIKSIPQRNSKISRERIQVAKDNQAIDRAAHVKIRDRHELKSFWRLLDQPGIVRDSNTEKTQVTGVHTAPELPQSVIDVLKRTPLNKRYTTRLEKFYKTHYK
ncbi:hypothetical protein KBD75_02415 [Candidatus Woesebacteria bacterium]|nr:hypothetical protein [Candidatus Woesebacteria bacterium]